MAPCKHSAQLPWPEDLLSGLEAILVGSGLIEIETFFTNARMGSFRVRADPVDSEGSPHKQNGREIEETKCDTS